MFGVIFAALMAASFFVPWVSFFGNEIGPMMLIDPPNGAEIALDWRGYAFLASFVMAGLAAVVALMRGKAGVLMVVAGGIPFALIAEQVMGARGQLRDAGIPIPEGGSPAEAFDMIREFVEIGAPMYFISAALLVLIGLIRLIRGT